MIGERHDLVSRSLIESNFPSPKNKVQLDGLYESLNEYEQEVRFDERSASRKVSSGPKIVITTPAGNSMKDFKYKEPITKSMISLTTPHPDKKATFRERVSQFFSVNRKSEILSVREQLKQKQVLSSKPFGAPKIDSGKLLKIIADQAWNGKNDEVAKTFKNALVSFKVVCIIT